MKRVVFLFIIFAIFTSCIRKVEKDNSEFKLDFTHQFILELIDSGILKKEYALRVEPAEFSYNEIENFISEIIPNQDSIDNLWKEKLKPIFILDSLLIIDTIAKNYNDSLWNVHLFSNFHPSSNYNLTSIQIEELKEGFSKNKIQSHKFNNDILGFNQENKNYWYRISKPVVVNENTIFFKSTLFCSGLCGAGDILLFEKQKDGNWTNRMFTAWFH